MNKKIAIVSVVLVVVSVVSGIWWFNFRIKNSDELTLYGNVDIRQVALAFDGSGRIMELLVEEGQLVQKDQVLAKLDKRTLLLQANEVKATIYAQEQAVLRLKNGSRAQEITQASAHLSAAAAQEKLAKLNYQRFDNLVQSNATSKQIRDESYTAWLVAKAKLQEAKSALELLQIGARIEDIHQAEAQLQNLQAHLASIEHNITLTDLVAPNNGVIRSRLLEVGDMANAQKPVFTLALTEPKWVRAYVSESNLGRMQLGMKAQIMTDSFAHQTFEATLSYIASVAEFTPKTVQTLELRTSLVYEIRLYVQDESNQLRLGMPVTVRFH